MWMRIIRIFNPGNYLYSSGSSEKSVGKIWDRQIAKSMIQSDFDTMIGSKPIGFSGSEFSFVVQTLEGLSHGSLGGPQPLDRIRGEISSDSGS
uniref:Uncharacterized protein n=1 Tax=Candidatus Kentrum sp. SD TaxID=2126332 RepID=A0A451BPT1_9GAMM|nr:MAG: hypothetical protein BECKSD772F_GA0070984_11589 [Candidatus Kentron sp. SD]VFK49170.1 MAG: hypothetical protein BECKSD772E_GA0070983_11619 [Candidatus Kentron sp. SD]VFK80257.1 MAG: hypothetical protein BECKSD772D_GA0070982_10973 [Candidatus Kentron sp. SD]